LKHGPERHKITLSEEKKNTKIELELGLEIMIHSHHLLCKTPKLQHEITEPILATLKH